MTGTNGILIPPPGLPAGPARAARRARHPADLRRGDGRASAAPASCSPSSTSASQPDIVTMAKGLTSSLRAARRDGLSRRRSPSTSRKNVFWGGLTYNAHPFCLAVAEAVHRRDARRGHGRERRPARAGDARGDGAPRAAAPVACSAHRNIGLFGIVELRKDCEGHAARALQRQPPGDGDASTARCSTRASTRSCAGTTS